MIKVRFSAVSVEHISRATTAMVTMLGRISSLTEGEGGSVVLASGLLVILVLPFAIPTLSFLLETIVVPSSRRRRCLARIPEHASSQRNMAES
jgi:hypothetical protein